MGRLVDLKGRNTVLLREMLPEDRNFILSSWLKAFKGSHFAGPIQYDLYYKTYQEVFERILARPHVSVVVAANPADSSQIFGYAINELYSEKLCLHWIYVKRQVRGFGIAGAMMEHQGFSRDEEFAYTFRVKNTPSYASKYRARFNPRIVCQKRRES